MNPKRAHLFPLLWPSLVTAVLYSLASPFISLNGRSLIPIPLILSAGWSAFFFYRAARKSPANTFYVLIRFFLLHLLIVWIGYKLISRELNPFKENLLTPGSLTLCFGCTAAWALTIFLAIPIIIRENLLNLLAPLDKNKLSAQARRYGYEVEELKITTGRIRLFAHIFTALSLTAYFMEALNLKELSPLQGSVLILLVIFSAAFLFHTKGWEEELNLLTGGVSLEEEWILLKGRRFLLLLLILTLPALLIARKTPVLPLSLITDLFAKLMDLLKGLFKEAPPVNRNGSLPFIEEPRFPLPSLPPLPEAGKTDQTPLLSDRFWERFRLLLWSFGGMATLLFLAFPLISRQRGGVNRNILMGGFRDWADFISRLGGKLFPRTAKRKDSSPAPPRLPRHHSPGALRQPSAREEQELPSSTKVLKAFNRLCRWGKKRNRAYSPGLSPADYLRSLTEILPQRKKQLFRMGSFLDNYFYSARLIEAWEIEDFLGQTRSILKEEK
ncbi:MAG: hypothetical protein PQJ60_12700 [Spirochaetales bacterium]|nr:hypothetical protein [Spirochaetales bacterium]